MDDVKKKVILELRNYNSYKVQAENLKEKISSIDMYMSPGVTNTFIDHGGDNSFESKIIVAISEKQKLEQILKKTTTNISIIDRSLNALSFDERMVINEMYINDNYCAVDKLSKELNMSRSSVYAIKNSAIKKIVLMITTEKNI